MTPLEPLLVQAVSKQEKEYECGEANEAGLEGSNRALTIRNRRRREEGGIGVPIGGPKGWPKGGPFVGPGRLRPLGLKGGGVKATSGSGPPKGGKMVLCGIKVKKKKKKLHALRTGAGRR